MRLPEVIINYAMPITLAESVDPLDMAEQAHITKSSDPRVLAQINDLLDDPITIERMAVNHSSLLVRLLAQRLMGDNEKIIGVAIKCGNGMLYSLPRPNRHHNVIEQMISVLSLPPLTGTEDQGFITNTGRFIDRVTAKQLALRNGQLGADTPHDELFVEDLW